MAKGVKGIGLAVTAALVMLSLWAATAVADPQYQGVGGSGGSAGGGGSVGGGSGSTVSGGASLPFTGADLALYVVIGVAIVASGLLLRRYASRRALV